MEVWREHPQLTGLWVSDQGRVWREAYTTVWPNGRERHLEACELEPRVGWKGYRYISYRRQGSYRVHVLMLETFVGPRPPGLQACHNDDDKDHNRIDNLRWDTPAGNSADIVARDGVPHRYGEAHPVTRYSSVVVAAIKASTGTHASIARRFGVSERHVGGIRNGKTRTRG